MGQNENHNFIKDIPDAIKGWLVMLGIIAGFIIAFRSERQLYLVISSGIIFVVWLYAAFYIAFSRLPGTFSKKGVYRYESYRWIAFINIGFIFGILFAFTLFTSNRLYVANAIMGTVALTPTSTPTSTPSPTQTPTIMPSATITIIPPTPTPTPTILFQDSFLNNENGWDLLTNLLYSSYYPNPYGKILGGKLQYGLSCSNNNSAVCESWLLIPHVTARNFEMGFEIAIINIPRDTPLNIGIKFRDKSNEHYLISISNKGVVSVLLQGNGINDYLARNIFSNNIKQELGETNIFKLVVKDSLFVVNANNSEIVRVEDGNIASEGNIYLGLSFQSNGNYGKVEIDNLKIQSLP